jgi:hypothetical protein
VALAGVLVQVLAVLAVLIKDSHDDGSSSGLVLAVLAVLASERVRFMDWRTICAVASNNIAQR